jgi:hypothetical protein
MRRLPSATAAVLLLSISAAPAREAVAANEDVPKGPTASPPTRGNPNSQGSPGTTGSTDKGKSSQNGQGAGAAGKPASGK